MGIQGSEVPEGSAAVCGCDGSLRGIKIKWDAETQGFQHPTFFVLGGIGMRKRMKWIVPVIVMVAIFLLFRFVIFIGYANHELKIKAIKAAATRPKICRSKPVKERTVEAA